MLSVQDRAQLAEVEFYLLAVIQNEEHARANNVYHERLRFLLAWTASVRH